MGDALDYIEGDLAELLQLLQASDVRELEVREGGVRLRLHRSDLADGDEVVLEVPETETLLPLVPPILEVTAPLVGTFYRAEDPDTPPLVDEGSIVDDTTVVGIIEALSVLNRVQAGCAGVVTKVLATDGQPVQYGQVLFEVTPGG